MRSRYTAYALGRVDHVIATTDPEGPARPPDVVAWRSELADYVAQVRFVGLRVLGAGVDGSRADEAATGWVHFRAELEQDGQHMVQEERSHFTRRDGRWLYWGERPGGG
jgi:SEC-C motif-containing protein